MPDSRLRRVRQSGWARPRLGKPRRRFVNPRLLSAITLRRVLALVFLLYLAGIVAIQEANVAVIRRDTQLAVAQLKEVHQANEGLRERVKALQTDAFVETLAREEFGLVKPGEIPITPIPAQ